MQFSERILKVKPSPTLAITALAAKLKSQGVDVIGFGSGEPDFDTPKHIKEAAIRAIESGKTKYTPVGGVPQMKEAIINKFKRDNNLDYSASEVTINCGGKHSFFNLMQVILNKDDEVIVPAPYWVSYPSMVTLADGKPVIVDTSQENNYKLTPAQLKNAVTDKTKAIVINSPSNPTGALYSKEEYIALAEVIKDKDIYFISDDIYEGIIYDNEKFINTAMISSELKEKTIILNGVSKNYAMTGWRLGYVAAKSTIIKKMEVFQSQQTSNPCTISQWASIEALNGDQSVVQEMVKAFDRRRHLITNGLNEIPGITATLPDGAFYTFPNIEGIKNLPGWSKIAESMESDSFTSQFTSYLLEEAKVAVVPGVAFGTEKNIRLSFATSDENISKGIERIKEAVNKLV